MNKQEFLLQLRKGLSGLPDADIEERINFYGEMIDDRIEDGLSEEDAVLAVGSVEEIVKTTMEEIPLTKLVKEKISKKKSFKAWEIVLLAIGSPLWLSLFIAVVAIVLSIYVSLWSVIVSLWSVFAATIGCAVGCIVSSIGYFISGNWILGIALLSAGITCTGLSIFMFFGCKASTNGIVRGTKIMALGIKNALIKKEEA